MSSDAKNENFDYIKHDKNIPLSQLSFPLSHILDQTVHFLKVNFQINYKSMYFPYIKVTNTVNTASNNFVYNFAVNYSIHQLFHVDMKRNVV